MPNRHDRPLPRGVTQKGRQSYWAQAHVLGVRHRRGPYYTADDAAAAYAALVADPTKVLHPPLREHRHTKGCEPRQTHSVRATNAVWAWAKRQHPNGVSDYLQTLYDQAHKTT